MDFYLALVLGFAAAAVGGELFVRGAVGLARELRVPAGIIGATVAAFATSSPELTVSVVAALAGSPQIALGDALGSNIVNVGLILALALLISGIPAERKTVARDYSIAVLIPVITGVLILDGVLSQIDGWILLGLFAVWLAASIQAARRRREPPTERKERLWLTVLCAVFGLGFLILAGRLVVTGAKELTAAYGIDPFVAGATIVALGTSTPELATAIISKLRGHDEIGLGTILGSNVFNGLFIVGAAATIAPIFVGWREVIVSLVFGVVLVVAVYPAKIGVIGRWRGAFLLALYAAFIAAVVQYG